MGIGCHGCLGWECRRKFLLLMSSKAEHACDAAASEPCKQAGIHWAKGSLCLAKDCQVLLGALCVWSISSNTGAYTDSFAYTICHMRYFAYDTQLQMAAVPCPIWFTDRQDASAVYHHDHDKLNICHTGKCLSVHKPAYRLVHVLFLSHGSGMGYSINFIMCILVFLMLIELTP